MSNHISKTALCLLMLPAMLYAQLSVRSISITTTSPSNNCTPPEPGGYTLTLQPGATCTLNCSVIVESYDPVLHHILIDFQSGRYFNQSMIGGPLDRGSLGDGVMHSKTIDITEELPHIHCRFLVHDMLFYSQLLPITVNHVTTEPPYSSSSSSILPTPSSSTFTVSSTPNTQQVTVNMTESITQTRSPMSSPEEKPCDCPLIGTIPTPTILLGVNSSGVITSRPLLGPMGLLLTSSLLPSLHYLF